MKLLLDQNLSPRLCDRLRDVWTEVNQVRVEPDTTLLVIEPGQGAGSFGSDRAEVGHEQIGHVALVVVVDLQEKVAPNGFGAQVVRRSC